MTWSREPQKRDYWAHLPFSGEAVFEDRVEARLSGVFRGGFLHLQYGFPAAKLEGGDVVIKPRLFVLQVPANRRLRNAGEAGEGLPDSLTRTGPAEAHGEPLGEAKQVPQRRTHRLVDGTLHTIPGVDLGQIAVVDVAGEDDDGGRRLPVRAFARADGPQQRRELLEGVVEGSPVLQVHELADELAELRGRAAPGAPADGFIPRFEVVQAGGQEHREGGAEEEVVEVSGRLALDPGPLLAVEHGAVSFL